MDPDLPFGRTELSPAEAISLMDPEQAAEILEEQGVANAEEDVESFANRVPALVQWLAENGREYPWRHTTVPWHIYVSEILLQRTRGDAVEKVYEPFFDRFSSPEEILTASDREIHEVIESLGFGNQRTRTLREVGEFLQNDHNGEVPNSLEELKRPYRVGPYSARACKLFAFGEPVSLVDANFARIFGRVFGLDLPSQPHKCAWFHELMAALVPDESAAARAFNLACIDLGALVCTPENPHCSECPLEPACCYASGIQ